MAVNKAEELINSYNTAGQYVDTTNVIKNGGCVTCGCELFICYQYEDGQGVPDAKFKLKTSSGKVLKGKTDSYGAFKIENMDCGSVVIDFGEGSDEFAPEALESNNPLLRASPLHSAMASEYFTLYTLLYQKGYLNYNLQDSSEYGIDINIDNVPWRSNDWASRDYELAWLRFYYLLERVNSPLFSSELRHTINMMHSNLPAELGATCEDNLALMMFCQIALGFVSVIDSVSDVSLLGHLFLKNSQDTELQKDDIEELKSLLMVIGFSDRLGHAVKWTGITIVDVLEKVKTKRVNAGENPDIQHAIAQLRSLSNGNIERYLKELNSTLDDYGRKAKAYFSNVDESLDIVLKRLDQFESFAFKRVGWELKAMMKEMHNIRDNSKTLIKLLRKKIEQFIPLLKTRVIATARKPGMVDPERRSAERAAFFRERRIQEAQRQQKSDKERKKKTNNEKHVGDPVNIVTGALTEMKTDFELESLLPLRHDRYYRSTQSTVAGLLGSVWRSSWDMNLTLEAGSVTFCDEDYSEAMFMLPLQGEPSRSRLKPEWTLMRDGVELVLAHVDGRRYYFNHMVHNTLRLTTLMDRFGHKTHFDYEFGTLKRVRLTDGRFINVETERNLITTLTLYDKHHQRLKTLVRYQYDVTGRLISVRGDVGKNVDYYYNEAGYLCRWQDLALTWMEFEYDAHGRVIETRGADGRWCNNMVYDDHERVSHYTNAFGGTEHYYYDEQQRIVRKRTVEGTDIHYEWDFDHLIAEHDTQGTTMYRYDENGNIIEVVKPNGCTYYYRYGCFGLLTHYTDPTGACWQYDYDDKGCMIRMTDPEHQQWMYDYDQKGILQCIRRSDGVSLTLCFNERGYLLSQEDNQGTTVHFSYDQLDRLVKQTVITDGVSRHQIYQYKKGLHQPISATDESGRQMVFHYDVEGNLCQRTDPLGETYHYLYGAFNRLMQVTDPTGAITRYDYNQEGAFARVTNPLGQHWGYRFDLAGRIVEEQHYDGRRTSFSYQQHNKVAKQCKADGSELHYHYDPQGLLLSVEAYHHDGELVQTVSFSYDMLGRLIKAQNESAELSYRYNRVGQVIEERLNDEVIVSHYDDVGDRVRIDGTITAITQRWQQGMLEELGIGTHQNLHFRRNHQGLEIARENGVGFSLSQKWSAEGGLIKQQTHERNMVRRYHYDVLNRVKGVEDNEWGKTQFTLNAQGVISQQIKRDKQGKLYQSLFDYDSALNLTEINELQTDDGITMSQSHLHHHLIYDQEGRVIQRGEVDCQYDTCGRLVEKREQKIGQPPVVTRYSWDMFDRLSHISLPDGEEWSYHYDPLGRRISKICQKIGSTKLNHPNWVKEERFLWDGDQVVSRQRLYTDGHIVKTQWIYEPKGFRPLAQLTTSSHGQQHLYYIIVDRNGSPCALYDEQGQLYYRGEQQLWGRYLDLGVRYHTRMCQEDPLYEPIRCDLRYQGQIEDRESGLYYNYHRYYDVELGQYLSPDPIGIEGGIRPQSFVDNPLERMDPLGLDVRVVHTEGVFGMHKKIEVDIGSNIYGISFGVLDEGGQILGLPFGQPDFGKSGSGRVYEDSDPATKVVKTFKTTHTEDLIIFRYLREQIGKTGPYNLLCNNCRVFSHREYKKIKAMIKSERRRKLC